MTPTSYNSTTDDYEPNNDYISNPRAKHSLNEIYTGNCSKNCKVVKYGNSFWCTINKRRGGGNHCKGTLNNWVINHSNIIVLPMINDCVKIHVPGKDENKFVSNLLLEISFRELYNDKIQSVS